MTKETDQIEVASSELAHALGRLERAIAPVAPLTGPSKVADHYGASVGSVEQRSRHRCSGPDLSADVTFDAQPDAAIKQAKAEGNLSRVRRPRVQDLPDGLAPHAMECWHVPTRAGSGLGGHSSGVGRGAARP